jgi:hypothetical protein
MMAISPGFNIASPAQKTSTMKAKPMSVSAGIESTQIFRTRHISEFRLLISVGYCRISELTDEEFLFSNFEVAERRAGAG